MLVSLKWLKDYVDIDLTADELAHRLDHGWSGGGRDQNYPSAVLRCCCR